VSKSISDAGKKTRTIERKLRGVESLSGEEATQLLGNALVDDNGGDTELGTDEEA
jgi:DNA recombination protein RmuC